MEICNLKKGMEIKNYRELCKLLNIKVKSSNSKKAQLKELERFCKYHKEGNRFIIDSIYKKVRDKEDNRKNNKGGNNSIYEENIEKILLYMCKYSNDKKFKRIELSVTGMLCCLNMINENFNIGRQQIKKFSRYLKIPIETIYDFYNSTYSNLESNVVRVLNKIQNRCLINWNYILKVKTNKGVHREATDQEIEYIKESELQVLKALKCKSKQEIFLNGLWNTFNKEVNAILRENKDIEYYYKAFKIITTEDFRKMIINTNSEELEFIKIELNSKVSVSCEKSANNRHNKVVEKYKNSIGLPKTKRELCRIRERYIDDTKRVINICVDNINFNNINLLKELNKLDSNNPYEILEALIDEDEQQYLYSNAFYEDFSELDELL